MARKNAGIISIGYRPEAPGTCRMTSATHTPLPTCMNVVERAKITDIYTSEVMTQVSRNTEALAH